MGLAARTAGRDPGLDRAGRRGPCGAKGAPEAIAELCRLDETARARLRGEADGWRPKGCACLEWRRPLSRPARFPISARDFAFAIVGLVGFADPTRDNVLGAVRDCRSAGIRVVMITGDYRSHRATIARTAGLDAEHVITGPELETLNDAALAERARQTSVFARIMPTQKLRIVQAFKASGEVVAMTGDGVNDAPSLKAADIGIAMGGRGTDVAREAASIVLLDDDFGSIVRPFASAGASTTICARRWATSWRSIFPSPDWRCSL